MVRNGFIRKKVDSLTLGEKLKKLRGEGRISLVEIARQTKIQVKYLEYLESGEYEKLPADVYVKGFLRSYAHYLNVDENHLLKMYSREKGIRNNINPKREKERVVDFVKFSNFSITPKKMVASAIILLTIGSFLYIYNELDTFISTPRLVVLSPSDGLVTEETSIYVSGETEKGADVFINSQATMVNDKGEFSAKVGLQEGLNAISVKAKNRFEKEAVQEIVVQANYAVTEEVTLPEEKKEATEVISQSEEINLEISVNPDPTWISVEADGSLVYSGTLLPTAVQSFKAKEKISVTSGRGNSTYIKLNGADKGVLSNDPGVVRNVTFTTDTKY